MSVFDDNLKVSGIKIDNTKKYVYHLILKGYIFNSSEIPIIINIDRGRE